MSPAKTVADIIDLWPSAERFAGDLACKHLSYGRVMKLRGRIPERYWPAVLAAASKRDLAVTHGDLIAAHGKTSSDSQPLAESA